MSSTTQNPSEMEVVPPTTSTKPPSSQKKGFRQKQKGNNYAMRKADKHREFIGKKVLESRRAERNAKFFDVSDSSALPEITTLDLGAPASYPVVLPISTVGIMRTVDHLYAKYSPFFNNQCTLFQLLRVTLAQFELQYFKAVSIIPHPLRGGNYFVNIPSDRKRVVAGNPQNFQIVCDMINSVGQFVHQDTHFYPVIPEKQKLQSLTYDSLRRVVTHYAQNAGLMPVNILPGAQFLPNGLLANANDYWPIGYNDFQLARDFAEVMRSLDMLRVKFTSIRGQCDYAGCGNPAILVCYDYYVPLLSTVIAVPEQPQDAQDPTAGLPTVSKPSAAKKPKKGVETRAKRHAQTDIFVEDDDEDNDVIQLAAKMQKPMTFEDPERVVQYSRKPALYWSVQASITDKHFLIGAFGQFGHTEDLYEQADAVYRVRSKANARQMQVVPWEPIFDSLTPVLPRTDLA